MNNAIIESVNFICSALPKEFHPHIVIILGSGLGGITDGMEVLVSFEYSDIPHFPISTVESHKGALVLGFIGSTSVAVLQGRFHYYEGYSAENVVYPLRVVQQLGATILIVTNACGGLHPQFRAGEIMLIDDHINLQWQNPLINSQFIDTKRFTDMSRPYSPRLNAIVEDCAKKLSIKLQKGTYLAVLGPNYETRAELRFMRKIGADCVGMSSVPETLIARQLKMEVLGISVITNECRPDVPRLVSHEEVLVTAAIAVRNLQLLLRGILKIC